MSVAVPAHTLTSRDDEAILDDLELDVRPFLVIKASHRCLRLRANQLRALQIRRANMPTYVGDARPDRFPKHWHSKHRADDESVTAGYQAAAR